MCSSDLREIFKEKFKSISENSWNYGEYDLQIIFTLKADKQIIKFNLNLDLLEKDFHFQGSGFYMHLKVNDLNDINNDLLYISKKIKEANIFAVHENNADNNNALDDTASDEIVSPGMYKLSDIVNEYGLSRYKSLLQSTLSKLDKGYYFESTNNSDITIFASGKRNKKNNPALYKIWNMNDPRETKVYIYSSKEEVYLFDDFDNYYANKEKKIIELLKITKEN